MRKTLLQVAAVLAGAALIGWVAMWNGYPIISNDSAGYIRSAFSGYVEARRPSLYPSFIAIISLKKTLRLVVAAQCLLASYYTLRTASLLAPARQIPAFLTAVIVSCACTTLPWFAGRVMPDFSTGLLVMGSLLLLVERQSLRSLRAWVDCALLLILTSCHVANIAVLLVICTAGYVTFSVKARSIKAYLKPLISTCSICAISVVVLCGLNSQSNGRFALTDQRDLWTMARLVRYGIVQRMLDERCNQNHYVLCSYKNDLSDAPDHFVFSLESPLRKIGGWNAPHELLSPMIRDANRYYWRDQLDAALKASASQFTSVWLNMGLGSHRAFGLSGPPVSLRAHYRAEYASYLAGRQRSGQLHFGGFNTIIVPAFWVSLFLLPLVCISALYIGDFEAALATVFVALALLVNASVMGVLNTPFDRYQSRVAWLIPVIVTILLYRLGSGGRRDRAVAASPPVSVIRPAAGS